MTDALKKTLRDSAPMRWFILVLVSGLMFGTYWFQDFFSGLKPLMESQMGINSSDFGMIIAFTTFANMFGMIMVGGIFLDRFGIRWTTIVFGSVVTFGAALTAMASSGMLGDDPSSRMTGMIIGRVLFGVGLEVTCVLITRTVVKWFKGYELALAMGVNMAFGRMGSGLGTAMSPELAVPHVSSAVVFAATIVGVGFIMFIMYLMFDVTLDKQNAASAEAGGEPDEPFRFSDLVALLSNPSFLYIALLCVAFYSAVFPFMQYAPDLLVNKFGFSVTLPDLSGASWGETIAAWLTNGPKVAALIPLGTILFTPIFGLVVDKKGKAATLMILGSVLLIFAHLALSVFNSVILGYVGLLALGVAFSLVPASMWPSVAKIVPENRLGTAYAAMFTIQNWGLFAFFWGIGKVLDKVNPEVVAALAKIREDLIATGLSPAQVSEKIETMRSAGEIAPYNYTIPVLMLVGLGVVSIFLAFMLKKADLKQGYGLEKPSSAR
jgi:MFS family permease